MLPARDTVAQHQAVWWYGATFAVTDELLQPVSDTAQAHDLSFDLRDLLLRPVAHHLRDVCAVLGQRQQLSNLCQRIAVRLDPLDELHQWDYILAVVPIASRRSRRPGEQPSAFVESDGLHVHAGSFGKFTDLHHSLTRATVIMRPVPRYKVKRRVCKSGTLCDHGAMAGRRQTRQFRVPTRTTDRLVAGHREGAHVAVAGTAPNAADGTTVGHGDNRRVLRRLRESDPAPSARLSVAHAPSVAELWSRR